MRARGRRPRKWGARPQRGGRGSRAVPPWSCGVGSQRGLRRPESAVPSLPPALAVCVRAGPPRGRRPVAAAPEQLARCGAPSGRKRPRGGILHGLRVALRLWREWEGWGSREWACQGDRPKLGGERQGPEGKRRGPNERIRAGPWDLRSQPTCSQMQVAKSGLVFRGRERGRSIGYRKQKEKLRLMADMVKQAPHPPQSPNASCWSTS